MSQFSTQLLKTIEELKLSQARFAGEAGISQPQISRYINGVDRPPVEVCEVLCSAIPDRGLRASLLAAYLEDEIPAAHRSLLEIKPRAESGSKVREEALSVAAAIRDSMPKTLRTAYDKVGRAAIKDPKASQMIIGMAGFIPDAA